MTVRYKIFGIPCNEDEFLDKEVTLTYLRSGRKYSVTIKPEELK